MLLLSRLCKEKSEQVVRAVGEFLESMILIFDANFYSTFETVLYFLKLINDEGLKPTCLSS